MKWRTFFAVHILLIWYYEMLCVNCVQGSTGNTSHIGKSDFWRSNVLSRIAFGSCMNGMFNRSKWYEGPQEVWKQIMVHQPDLWIWLGDAAYSDTRVLPLVWKPSSLSLMAKYFARQKNHPDYQEFIKSGVTILGVWDDHDYGLNDGGKHYHSRLQSQDIYLDFIDEPLDSIRREREGLYVSYTFGHGDKAVKLILLDVRSFAVSGANCDLLGSEQWEWLTEQLHDPTPVALTIVTSGIQILSNSPVLQNWEDCPQSYDRLIWLTRQREKVIYLSGDVHFGEVSCLNSSSSGYPIYEVTSSGLYLGCSVALLDVHSCTWLLRNMAAHDTRITEPVVERNFGFIEINWDVAPIEIKIQVFGANNNIAREMVFNLDHIKKKLNPDPCPSPKPKPSSSIFYLFLLMVGIIVVAVLGFTLILLFFICKICLMIFSGMTRRLRYWMIGTASEVKEKKS